MLEEAASWRGASSSYIPLAPAAKHGQGATENSCSSLPPPHPLRAERLLLTPVFLFTDSLPVLGHGYVTWQYTRQFLPLEIIKKDTKHGSANSETENTFF